MKSKVLEVRPAGPDYGAWYIVKLTDADKEFLLHQNWDAENGELKPGDEVEYEVAEYASYSQAEYLFFRTVKRLPKETLID